MTRFLLRKISLLVAGWFCASIIIFFTLRLLPGDVAQVIAGTQATPATVARLRAELGLNEPLWTQYIEWIWGFVRGDLGTSLVSKTPVAAQLFEKSQVTVPLLLLSVVFTVLLAVPLGVLLGFGAGKKLPDALAAVCYSAAAAPAVWVALLMITVFAHWLGWFPAVGFPTAGWRDPLTALGSLLLPALTIAVIDAAVLLRFVRSATISALAAEPVRTGMSFGYTRLQAVRRFGLPAASLSLLGTVTVQVAGLIVGAVLVEKVFALPGVGSLLVTAVGNRDLTMVASLLLAITGFVLLLGFLLDMVQAVVDPRLREGGA